MFSKRNIKLREEKNRDEKQRFSIRKLTIGATSVLVGVSFFMYGAQSASAATTDDAPVVEESATEPSKEDGNKVVESNNHNDSKNNTDDSKGSGDAQRDVTSGTQSEKTESNENAKNSVETADKAVKSADDQVKTQSSSADNNVKTEKDNSESKKDSSLETGSTAASQNVIGSQDKHEQTSPSVKTADEPKIVDNANESPTATTVENSKATQTENAPVVKNDTTSTEIQNNTSDTLSQKNTNSSTLTSQDANSKVNQKNAKSDTRELEVPTVNKVEPSKDVGANTLALNLEDTKHQLTNNMSIVESEKIGALSVKNRAMLLTSLIAEDPNAVTVNDAKGFINAIQNGTATTINVAKNLNLADQTDKKYTEINIKNKRNIVIQSDNPEEKRTIDFSGYSFDMNTENSVTFKDLNIYARSYWGLVYNAGGYTFNNVNFTGSQLIYTKPWINSTLTFKNNITANSVSSYVGPLDGKTRDTQQNGGQQILQFEGGTNQIIFDKNSNVTLTTEDANALEIDGGTTTIDVKDGANVAINPHSKGDPESRNGIGTGDVARAIAANAKMTINIDPNSTLTINTEKVDGDKDVAGALYLNSDAALNVNGKLVINSNGTPSANKSNGVPVYINGSAKINVGNGGSFSLDATNLGNYSSSLISINGKGTVKLDPHSSFKISGDGTGALTAINLSSGSTFTSDQPDSFTIDLSKNTNDRKALIKNGTINFSRVKTVATDGITSDPLGKIDVTYDGSGNVKSYIITAQDENTVKQVADGLTNKSVINLVQAGEDVTLSNLHLSKNNVLTGTVASSGSNNPIYVTVTVGGVSTNVPVDGNYTVYTNTNGTVTSDNVDYAAQTASTGGNFSIDLSKLASNLTDDAQVTVTATKDFVESAQTKSVAALRALNTTTLKELVDAAPAEEEKPSYYNATEEAQKAYTDAISNGKTILDNPKNYDQVDVDNAVTAIQKAQKALTGEPTNKTKLQAAIDQASTVKSSDNYTNADSNLQKAYTDAISAGQTVLSNDNATQTEVDNALTTINNAKAALNGDAKKAVSKEALQKAVNEASTVKSDDAAYYNGSAEAKTAYDNAITAGQAVLDNPDATATQITDALKDINTAKGNLKGEATDKSALQKAVDNSATVKESNNYTNADETQKTAYDNAVTAAQTVLDKTNATQSEVNQALQDLETANNNLNGDAKTEAANKAALEAAVKDAPNVRNTSAYYNGSEENQTAYNNAINAGQAVLDQANPSASEVKNALDAINAAKDNLKGEATNTEALETALTNANNAKETGNYTNADQANQEVLNNAITAGQEILKNTNATQAEVNNAAKAITDAINGLNGDTNLTNAKTAATEDIQKALDTKTTEITDATNIDQATKDQLIADAKKAAEDANTAINQATNANAVNTAKTEGITKINNVKIPSLNDAKTNAAKEIDQALADKTKEINNAENIDQTTKDQLIQEATDAANTAKNAIEKATTNDAATKAGQDGVGAINNVKIPSVTDSQNAAKEAIDDALNAKTKEINDANNIDQTTKDQLIKAATDAANTAKEAIDKATTAKAIKTAQDEGTTNINNVTVPSLEDAKKAANKAVDDALTAQTEVINKANNLSDAEKKDLIDQATAEANKAKENIGTATTNNEAAQAGKDGVDAINKIVPTSLDIVKSDANKAIENALTKKLEEINSANDLTTDEKTALTQEANTAADKAKEEITNATTNDAVIEAQNNGVSEIDGIKVPTESAVKEAAKKAVADAATAKNNAIDASNLTNEEKAALKQKVTDAQNAADQAIDNATTNAAVTEAQTNGIKAINGIEVTTSTVKEAAKKAVADAATAKNNAIDASNLTDEEKAALKQKVTEAQNAADQAIDNATTNAAVTEAQTNGVNAINDIEVPAKSDAKEQATTDLNTTVDEAKKAIDQDSNLTDEEKQAAKDQIDSDATKAQEAINNAKTNDDVKKAADAGTLAIDKDVANAAIDNAVAGKKAEISNSSLTDEEKTALNNEVDQKANVAKEAINNATTPEAVTTAQENGIKNINDIDVPTESAAKQAAKQAVADAATAKNNAIDASNLTDEEKAALKQEVTEAQNAANTAIDNATTNAAVTEAEDKGISAIDGIEVPTTSANKEKAITDLNNEVEKAKQAIDQDSNLTDEEKQAVKDQIDSDAKTAEDAINNAKTDNDVNNAVNSGKVAIAKAVANAAIDNAVAGKLKEIQDPLTTEEKQAYTDLINSEANNAKQNIANATTVEEVTTAQTNGVNEITNTEIPTTSSAKDKAIAAINDALQKKTDEINNASNINTQEKTDLINQANEAANAAKNNINNATTNADVDTAQTNGEKAIADVTVPNLSDVKKESIDLINKALDAKTNEINNASNLSQDEKQRLINDATNAATEAINNINQAQTNDDAKAAATTGVQNIENITIPSLDKAKKNANQAIDDALNSKVNEINNASNLNETEKQKLVDQATEAATTAKNNVENATTNDGVRDAANAGIDNIKGISFTSLEDAKNAANTAIDNALQVKTDEINNASNLSTDEKQDLINQATEVAKNAKDNINNATTNDAVTEAQNKGIADIANVTVPSLAQAKQDAINAIKQVQDAKNKQISAASNLSAEEQKELSDQVDKIANDAIDKINESSTTTNEAVTATRDDAIKQITDLFIPTLEGAQTDALNAIESAKNAKLTDINNATHLTDQEKQALVDQTNKAADDATKEIKGAQTNDAVKSAETAGLDNINNITIPTLVQKQQEAIGELNVARDAKNRAIDDATDLTTDEKNSLKDKVQAEYSNAVSNITSATTDEAVTTAKENGIAAIKDIQIPTKSPAKEQATSDLNTAVDEAKNAIDQDNNLTDEEKQAAKDQIDSDAKKAQEAIDNATTNDEVNTAVDNGKLAIDKDIANAAIDNAVSGKKNEISKSLLTDEEKAALNDEVDEKAQAAKDAINNATTPEAVSTAQENGIKKINDTEVPTESAAKEAAKKAVAEAAEAKNNAIDSSNLTAEEKSALKQEVADAQNAANTAIDNATINAAVTEAEDNGIKAINSIEVPTKSDAKEQATSDLNTAVDEAKKAIDQDSNLTDEEKQAAKDQIDSDAKKAQEAIDTAKTNDDVKNAIDDGTLAIDKDVANAAIDDAAAGKKAEISKSSLTAEEKTALNNEVDEKANTAKDAINNATTLEAVTTAQEDGIKNINNTEVPTESAAKEAAKKAVAEAAEAKNNAIDSSNLTDEEKSALKQDVTEAQNAANTAIDNAITNSEVTEAQDNGVKTINGIEVPTKSTTKEQATTDLNNEVEDAKKAVDQDNNLTDEEKQAAKDQIDSDAKKAQDAINNAKTNDDVKKAVDDGKLVIDKDVANAAIDNAVAGKKAEISKSSLTDEEKTALNNEVDQKAQDAKEAINNATTPEAVSSAQESGIKNINGTEVPSVSPAKTAAKEAVQTAATDKITAINNALNLTKEEKLKLVDQVNNIVTQADANIDKATTNAVVEEAQENGISDINNIEIPATSSSKDKAANTIDQAADEAKKVIDATPGLTEDQKQAAKDQIDQDAENTKNNIAKATDDQGVQDATDAGLLDIDKVTAKTAVDSAAAIKKDEISKAPLTTDEAKNLNDLVDAEAQAAKDAIDGATTIPAVEDAKNTGVDTINNIQVPTTSPAKANANQAIDNALANKTQEINDASNLSDKQKQDLIDKATQEAEKAKDNIQNATSDEAVNQATDNGVEAIANITVPSLDTAKQDATQLIDDVLKQKEDEINNATHLTDEEKNDLIKQAEDAANEAKDKINQSTTNDDVAKERDRGIEKITNIKVPSLDDAKKNASKAIDDALEDKTKEINDQSNLSDKEKNNLIDQVTEIANKAKDKINHDVTNAEIAKDEKEGIDEIVNTKVPGLDDHKRNAIDSLDEAKTTKLTEISNATNLTAKEKNQLTQQVNTEYNKALDNINKATTNSEADKASADGVAAILNIEIPSLSEKKQDSIDALNEVREAKKEEINNATNLSEDEKDKLTKQVDQIADNAINAINGAKDDQAVKDAEDKGIHDILDVKVPSLDEVKNNAKQAIADALESKTKQINDATNLDTATKQDLINQANDVAEKANKNIENATSNDAALKAADEGVKEINSINIPSLDSALEKALNAIQDALTNKLDEINKATYLPQSERNELITQANKTAEEAVNAVNAAKTNSAVQEAASEGVKKINAIVVPAQVIDNNTPSNNDQTNTDQTTLEQDKNQAIDSINNSLNNKVSEINNASHLTNEEKQNLIDQATAVADKAKEAINNASTSEEVEDAKNKGIEAIDKIVISSNSTSKQEAINTIDNALKDKIKDINNASNLSNKEKQNLIDQATAVADKAKEAINNATDATTVKNAMDQGVERINSIEVPNKVISKKDTSRNSNNVSQVEKTHTSSHANRKHVTKESNPTSLNTQNPKSDSNLNKIAKNKKVLPQTGSKQNEGLVALGLLAVGIAGLISILGSHKKKD